MKFNKESVEYRYLFDIDRGILHDMQSPGNPNNEGCGLENMENWICFDTERTPMEGALIKKLTTTREVVDIEVRSLCPHCMSVEDQGLVDLLQNYILSQSD